jgi:hypothetical protein
MPEPLIPSVEHSALCVSCGNQAGRIGLFEKADGIELIRESFTSRLTLPVVGNDADAIRRAVVRADVRALYEHDLELACFYCPECDACYCGDHWARWNVFDDEDGFDWHDSVRGRCPQGHQRMLED